MTRVCNIVREAEREIRDRMSKGTKLYDITVWNRLGHLAILITEHDRYAAAKIIAEIPIDADMSAETLVNRIMKGIECRQ